MAPNIDTSTIRRVPGNITTLNLFHREIVPAESWSRAQQYRERKLPLRQITGLFLCESR